MAHQRFSDEDIRVRLVGLRLVLGAMIGATVIFALVATWLQASGFTTDPKLLVPMGGALLLVGIGQTAAWPVVRSSMVRKLGPSPSADEAVGVFATLRLVGGAMAEGFALFGIAVYLLTGSQLALVAPAIGIFLLLRFQPDPAAFRDFAQAVGVVDLPPR